LLITSVEVPPAHPKGIPGLFVLLVLELHELRENVSGDETAKLGAGTRGAAGRSRGVFFFFFFFFGGVVEWAK
jgi:hypothetical protein